MHIAHIIADKAFSSIIEIIFSSSSVSISFYSNGILFINEHVSYFIDREHMYIYNYGENINSFNVLFGDIRSNFATGPYGTKLTITREDGFKMKTEAIGSNLKIVCDIDPIISVDSQGTMPSYTDKVIRCILELSNLDINHKQKIEFPVIFDRIFFQRLNINNETLASVVVSNKIIYLLLGGNPYFKTSTNLNDMQITGNVSISRLKEFGKLVSNNYGIMGILQPLGDFGAIWYIRTIQFGRVIFVL